MYSRKTIIGFIGFDSVREELSWPAELVRVSRGACKVFVNALERKKIEDDRRGAEFRYRQVVEEAAEVIYTCDLTGKFKFVNKAALKCTGYSAEELLGMTYLDLVLPYYKRKLSVTYAKQYVSRGAPSYIEYPFRKKSGEVMWFGQNASLLYEGEEIVGFHVVARDITDRIEAEKARIESEARYRSLIDSAPYIIFTFEIPGSVMTSINPAFDRITGWPREEWIGKKFTDIVHPLDLPVIKRMIIDVLKRRPTEPVEMRFQSKDGEEMFGEVMAYPQFNGDKIVAVLGIIRDITDTRQAQIQVRQQAALLDEAQDAIFVSEISGILTYWNKSSERLFGWSAAEVIGKNVNELLHCTNRKLDEEAFNATLSLGEWQGEVEKVSKDGAKVIVSSRWTLVKDSEGAPKSILHISTDISEKKKLESQFLRNQRMESLGTLAGGIAHDLNNVLSPILMAVHLLRSDATDQTTISMLDTLETSAQRGSDIVKQVLTFARGVEGERAPIQPKYLISEIEKIIRQTFPKHIQIHVTKPADLPMIAGDSTQLHQVLMNLSVNARDAMPDGGTLSIEAEEVRLDENFAHMHHDAKQGTYILFSVSDTGMGIPPMVMEKMFEPFFTTKGFGKGTGLGLSTVSAIVKSHGGFISPYSEVGKGTQFKVYFPADPHSTIRKIQTKAPALPRGNGELVLVVDDEPGIRDITQQTLKAFGYNVVTANDGTEGLSIFAEEKDIINLVITDMMMPFLDGLSMIRAMKKMRPDLRFVAASGLAEHEKKSEIKSIGGSFLHKPFTADRLLRTVHSVLTESGPIP